MDKGALRQQIRVQLAGLTKLERQQRSIRICRLLEKILTDFTAIAVFAPQAGEPDLDWLWRHGFWAERTVCYPRCTDQGDLEFVPVSDLSQLTIGRYQLREPAGAPFGGSLQAVVVPGIAFTQTGWRLGRGGGYYDRTLVRLPATTLKIGVCFQLQIVPELALETHDIRVDRIIAA
jgi:5-formyltetrahydrofolate cyclo-ligase